MDIPRYALIAASVLLGLMLLGEWTRFSTTQQEAALPAVPMVETEAGGSDIANARGGWPCKSKPLLKPHLINEAKRRNRSLSTRFCVRSSPIDACALIKVHAASC